MSNDVQIWKRRWESIDGTIKEAGTNLAGKTIDRKAAFTNLVQALESFGKAQFDFFFNGFGFEDPINQTLEKSLQYPPEFVLKRILDQMANDIWVIENAIKQREDSNKVDALKQADLLAFRAIEPVLGRLLPAQTTAITYFQKISEVRILPYANVVLIGIPYSANLTGPVDKDSNLRDLLAIPHEVGHYVFWRSMVNGDRLNILLRQKLAQEGLSKYGHWLEEIFADVYGCLIGGAAFALSAQDIQLDNMPIRLTADDGKHPAAVLRPYISTNVLDSEAGQNAADAVGARWNDKVKSKGNPQTFHLDGADHNQPNTVSDAIINDIPTIVGFILSTLKSVPNMANVFQLDWSDKQPSDPADLTSLYKSFAEKLDQTGSALKVGSIPVPDYLDVPNKDTSWVYKLRDDVPIIPANKMPAEIWLVVMNAAGWGGGGQEETYPN